MTGQRTRRAVIAGLGLMLGGSALMTRSRSRTPVTDPGPPATFRPARFPIQVAKSGRFLEDADGRPFLLQGDSAWSLIADLGPDDAQTYLADRRTRGFNAILASLLEHRFSRDPPRNASGDEPFLTTDDYRTPNPAYFGHAEQVLRMARDKGLLVLLTPSYLGAGGGPEGWWQAMVANGPSRLHAYGRFLGQRFREFDNVIWVNGGDFDPPDKAPVRAIAEGLRETMPNALQTAHAGAEQSGLDVWAGEHWLGIDTVYSYDSVGARARQAFERPEKLPFILIESAYENEHGASEERLRSQAWRAILGGAAGQIFGNNPIWHFDGPGIYRSPTGWREALDSRGARSMTHLRALMEDVPWSTLTPDTDGRVLKGFSGPEAKGVAAAAGDGSLVMTYTTSSDPLTLDVRGMESVGMRERWFDPSSGRFGRAIGAGPPSSREYAIPGRNAAGFGDWVLVIQRDDEARAHR